MSTWEMQFFRLGEIITREDIYASGIKSLKSITLLKKIYQYWDLLYFYQKIPEKTLDLLDSSSPSPLTWGMSKQTCNQHGIRWNKVQVSQFSSLIVVWSRIL